jgi:hypothetical protein
MFTILRFFLGKAVDFLKPILKAFASSAGIILAEAATAAVANVAQHYVLTGDSREDDSARRDKAYQQIVNQMAIKGVTMSAQIIYAAIETAVENAKRPQ